MSVENAIENMEEILKSRTSITKMVDVLTFQEFEKLLHEAKKRADADGCKKIMVKIGTEGGGIGGCAANGYVEVYCEEPRYKVYLTLIAKDSVVMF